MATDDVFLATVELPAKSGLGRDTVVNTFAFIGDGVQSPQGNATDFQVLIEAFYNTVQGASSRSIANFISPSVDRATGVCLVNYYYANTQLPGTDKNGQPFKPGLQGGPHGSPWAIKTWTLGAPTAGYTGAPSELAVVLSFHSQYSGLTEEAGGTRPKSRHRGRLYIGPLCKESWDVEATTNRVKVIDGLKTTIGAAAAAMINAGTAGEPKWAQWSRKNAELQPVVGGWVDDAFDIQRRRGEKSKTRTTIGPG